MLGNFSRKGGGQDMRPSHFALERGREAHEAQCFPFLVQSREGTWHVTRDFLEGGEKKDMNCF